MILGGMILRGMILAATLFAPLSFADHGDVPIDPDAPPVVRPPSTGDDVSIAMVFATDRTITMVFDYADEEPMKDPRLVGGTYLLYYNELRIGVPRSGWMKFVRKHTTGLRQYLVLHHEYGLYDSVCFWIRSLGIYMAKNRAEKCVSFNRESGVQQDPDVPE